MPDKQLAPRQRNFRKALYKPIPSACLLCIIYCLVTTLAPRPHGVWDSSENIVASGVGTGCKDGLRSCICPREAICAESILDIAFLIIARLTIYTVYPYIMFMFLSKANFLIAHLQTKVFDVYLNFAKMHEIHVLGGKLVEAATWIHVLFHLLRWALEGQIVPLLFNHQTGLTGFVAVIILPMITWPMKYEKLKKRLSFETRKGLHYLSWVWGLAMVFHAPATNIAGVMGFVMIVYFLNYLVALHSGTFLVESTIFRRLGDATLLSFANPKGFELQGASYVCVMLPWIDKYQWHAFSVFPHPREPNTSSVCIAAIGDWSKELHKIVSNPTSRAAWVQGPFLSPFASAMDYDNIISLATGIGITPALAVLTRFKYTRRVNLVWMCRSASLVEFFVNIIDFPSDVFIFIFYTGKTEINLGPDVPPNVFIFKGRPNLEYVITSTIDRIENKTMLPESIHKEGSKFRKMTDEQKVDALAGRIVEDYGPSHFFKAAAVDISTFESPKEVGKPKEPLRKRRNSTSSAAFQTMFNEFRFNETDRNPLHTVTSSLKAKLVKTNSFNKLLKKQKMGITKESLADAVKDFFGDGKFSPKVVNMMFDKIDTDKNGMIDENECVKFLIHYEVSEILGGDEDEPDHLPASEKFSIRQGPKAPCSKQKMFSHFTSKTPVECPKINKSVSKNWLLQYCGGSAPVVRNLKDIHRNYDLDLKVEKFDW